MNWQNILITIALLLAVGDCAAQSKKKITVPIKDIGSATAPKPDVSRHKHHDAEFFRMGDSYQVTYYQLEKDSIRAHGAIPSSKDVMNKAEYYWDKDTIVVRLFNTATQKEKSFKAFGYGPSSSIKVDD